MKKTVCFGEIMLRLSPKGFLRFAQADDYALTYGGAESNVAVDLAMFGDPSAYVTALPNNDLADGAIAFLRKVGVGTADIVRGGERMGVYWLEKGASQRASKVVYDRKYSAASQLHTGEIDWARVCKDAAFFFTSGITAALGGQMPDVTLEAVRAAKQAGARVAFDINYRASLWSKAEAGRAIERILPYVDVLITNVYQADDVLGIRGAEADVCAEIRKRFGCEKIYTTARRSLSASDNVLSAALWTDGGALTSREYAVRVVDRVGGGDAFAAGVIHGELAGWDDKKTLEFALAASVLKHSIEGDVAFVTADEVLRLAEGDGSGRIVR